MRSLLFQVSAQGDRYAVQLSVDGGPPAEAEFDADILAGARLGQVIGELDHGNCRLDDLKDIGIHLWDALFHADVEALFEKTRVEAAETDSAVMLRLSLPPMFEALPWETLYDERHLGFVAIHPGYSIVRAVQALAPPRLPERPRGPLSILVLMPEGAGLHIDHEWSNLRFTVDRLPDAVKMERMTGRVTPDLLRKKLTSQPWDVLHYVGHGEVDAHGTVRIRLNDEGPELDYWMEAEPFASLLTGLRLRLVLLNCCLGGVPDPRRTLGGLGPYLMRAGVPAAISMRYEIQDDVAIKLSDAFYRELLTGQRPGRVDLALRDARHAIHLSQRETTVRGFITPILHLAKGFEKLFDVAAPVK